ncbi:MULTISPECIES: hypothetical protein [Actinosynnema]|uniref:hypothetical protein n=1 Tax=Actinosynnema TaxID=40566 RepID=UPI0020A274D3|nr:hypothetical protein [Actinosynnema pretiosum]
MAGRGLGGVRYYSFAEAVGERFAASHLVAGVEHLDLLGEYWNRMGSTNAPFLPPAGRPLRLRHVAVRAAELIHLLESGLVPEPRSARTVVESAREARALAACAGLARLELFFRCERSFSHAGGVGPHFGTVLESEASPVLELAGRAAFLRTRRWSTWRSCGAGTSGSGASSGTARGWRGRWSSRGRWWTGG